MGLSNYSRFVNFSASFRAVWPLGINSGDQKRDHRLYTGVVSQNSDQFPHWQYSGLQETGAYGRLACGCGDRRHGTRICVPGVHQPDSVHQQLPPLGCTHLLQDMQCRWRGLERQITWFTFFAFVFVLAIHFLGGMSFTFVFSQLFLILSGIKAQPGGNRKVFAKKHRIVSLLDCELKGFAPEIHFGHISVFKMLNKRPQKIGRITWTSWNMLNWN